MSVYLGSQLLSGVATNTISNGHSLFDFKWTDHIINEMSWLRSDTFSWQDGSVYDFAYNHLNADYNGGTSTTETVGSYTITYVLAEDGHKITTDETTVANIYAESGVAWYYVIDQANTRFKLPRTKYGFNGLRDEVGKYVPESLPIPPDHTHTITQKRTDKSGTETHTVWSYNENRNGNGTMTTSEPSWSSSSVYQDNAPVQERATQMYLYFYVGNYSQSATEQTAGLNSELFNGKMDRDMSNMNASQTAKETIVGWGMPDYSAVVELSSSSFPYTATKKGIVYIQGSATNGNLKISVNDVVIVDTQAANSYVGRSGWVIVDIGDVVTYSAKTFGKAQFIPLKGTQNA